MNCNASTLAPPCWERARNLFKVVLCLQLARLTTPRHPPPSLSALLSFGFPGLLRAWDKAPLLSGGCPWAFNPLVDAHGSAYLQIFLPLSPSSSGTVLLTYPPPDFLSHPGTKHVLCL